MYIIGEKFRVASKSSAVPRRNTNLSGFPCFTTISSSYSTRNSGSGRIGVSWIIGVGDIHSQGCVDPSFKEFSKLCQGAKLRGNKLTMSRHHATWFCGTFLGSTPALSKPWFLIWRDLLAESWCMRSNTTITDWSRFLRQPPHLRRRFGYSFRWHHHRHLDYVRLSSCHILAPGSLHTVHSHLRRWWCRRLGSCYFLLCWSYKERCQSRKGLF